MKSEAEGLKESDERRQCAFLNGMEVNMKEYTLSQKTAIVGLDGLEVLHMTMAKSAVLRAIAAAQFLDGILPEKAESKDLKLRLAEALEHVKGQKKKRAQALEKEIAGVLEAEGVLEEAPDLLGCDMNYVTAGVTLKTYRSDKDVYRHITEGMRAEILEKGPVTEECICMLWLLRESGCMHDIFSIEEQKEIEGRMMDLTAEDEFCKMIWEAEFHSGLENIVGSFLQGKNHIFRNPYLEGVNLLFPFLDRRQSIFIDFVVLGSNVQSRRYEIMSYLTERGHYVEEVKNGTETLLKIDNAYYRIWPTTVWCSKIPIQGAKLLPVYK